MQIKLQNRTNQTIRTQLWKVGSKEEVEIPIKPKKFGGESVVFPDECLTPIAEAQIKAGFLRKVPIQ